MKRLRKKRKPLFFIVIFMILFLLLGGTFAWYLLSWKKQEADRENIEIMTPYFLYLLNPGDNSSLQFSVGNIHPGEVKRVVICVSNQKPNGSEGSGIDIAKESDFQYDLEFIYTENLPLVYQIYELEEKEISESNSTVPAGGIQIEGVTNRYWVKKQKQTNATENSNESGGETQDAGALIGTDMSETRWKETFNKAEEIENTINLNSIENKGKYWLYEKDVNDQLFHLKYAQNQYEYDYYLIEMKWKDGADFTVNAKETDLLYVVVNAKQPKPQLATTEKTE